MPDLRILTINLFNDLALPEALATAVQATAPDLVAAQELGPESAAVLAATFPHGRLVPALDHSGRGLVGRAPLEIGEIDIGGRPALVAALTDEEWALATPPEVVSVHLMNPVGRPVAKTNRLRRQQIRRLEQYVAANPMPRAIVGDMNASPVWPAYRQLAQLGADAARASGSAQRTWAPRWWMPRLLRIDHAFVTGMTPRHTHIVTVRGTDHSGLVVDLDIP
jgi:endonuclease/exonuclease/phosphatase family metal-dependent hydrolase